MKTAIPRPVGLFYFLLWLIFGLLFLRIFFLQVVQKQKYSRLATLNHVRIVPEAAPRGQIFDRCGRVLATSQPVFTAFLYPSGQEKREALARISQILKISEAQLEQKIQQNSAGIMTPVLLKERLDFKEMARLEEEKFQVPGLVIQRSATRHYPYGKNLAHVLGYVSSISSEELEKKKQAKETGIYSVNDFIGKDGAELLYEESLRGRPGGLQVAVDAVGRSLGVLDSIPPEAGEDLHLTIDAEMQAAAEGTLGEKKGAVVVLDTTTGEVLVLASHPAYDPNMFSGPIEPVYWQMQKKWGYPFFNRAINGYPPGSVFKLVTATAGLETGKLSPQNSFYCPGFLKLGVRKAFCWEKRGHGVVDLMKAIVLSCDVAFYQIGLHLGLEPIVTWARHFGFGSKTGIELPAESAGNVPTAEWKKKKYAQAWYPGDTINLAIGQGFIQATPLQVALFMEALANGGIFYYPQLVKKKILQSEKGHQNFHKGDKILGRVEISPETLNFIKESLRQVVKVGTGQAARFGEVEIAGKTGTAEDPPRLSPHAWFACFAPYEKPKLALVVFVEQGGHGGAVAAPIAKEIIQWWYENKK
jgi:penicillin-binding protein 2